ncbi:FtsQ-type POTRA domain-containing protein [Coleofasciculus sp. FACHB-1120]|uniref:cell division protein FtsQ/DivIB n=1 Tax=Coleofasciculus sp. FACHB-1120 TaxID=2692783 RepID=UPI001689B78C|nr:FtsQ-type POTRA domain-containing protein [Coleofasciculus sp. FACHB-1120]MBD2742397.1 FtsQ-type POTRA domain-containing protein [Coleofasciculus sp. FACHB-1120]
MTSIASVSQTELSQRRQKLRRQRRVKSFQAMWRVVFATGLAGGLVWVTTLPAWVIRKPEQIAIEGNKTLSITAIRSLLPLSYPQYLLRLQPQLIAEELELQPAIKEAIVTRQMLPPGLTVQVKERQPVAIALRTQTRQTATSRQKPSNSKTRSQPILMGLLDEQGVWMPLDSYTDLERTSPLPTLKIIGYRDEYRPYWSALYQAVSRSPVKVFEIDWQNPANLILKTEQGWVHFGAYTSRFTYQLTVLDRMRDLPAHFSSSEIAYIDLKNPDAPAIQMKKGNPPQKTKPL